ncbi:amino acid permease [Tanticharoenia sakaeratensis]|uniref:Amino acid permease-associated protein n=1 Tax=Tanticharoenia sakaeratensis NBRC 103193 TaxID=1231623 RepID=A0A0D6MIV0_9PROT|nr:amino acid permease [Tanticharoenia sakaeratensis]GAN53375.1 amino acid permease-associated protein [Tanticharoenia sakaeratensis NBRC 103193]GBQ20829.1 amino acid transporter [Tanticharoenia sakaeratensis NBRC 103193]
MAAFRTALFRRRDLSAGADGHGGARLARVLGPWHLVALGIGCTIGAGLFSLTGIAASQSAGPAVSLSYVIAAVACGFAGLCYSELAGAIPISGSAYTYAYIAFGELLAWIIGWDLVLEYTVGAATVAVSWSSYAASLARGWGIAIDPRIVASPFEIVTLADGTKAHGLVNLPAAAIIWIVTALLVRGISESARVNAVIVVIKLAVIAAVIAFASPYIHTANYHPFIPPNDGTFGHFGPSGVMRAAGMVFFAYIGFDVVSAMAGETRNPARDMPVGILGSLIICAVAYVAFALVLTGVVNFHDMLGDASPVATAIDRTPFNWLKPLVKLGVICGFTSVLLVLLLGQARVFFAMARDGLLPALFARLNARTKAPAVTHVFFGIITSLLSAFLPIAELGNMTSIGTLFAFVLVCIGVLVLRRRAPEMERRFKVPGGAIIPVCGIVVCSALMVSLDGLTWARLIVWLIVGLAIYFGYGMRNSRLA